MIRFALHCTPTPQARVRHGVVNGRSMAFKSSGQRANERTLDALLAPYVPKQPLDGPVALEFIASMPVLRSASKRARAAMLSGFLLPTKKPDLDNLAKQLQDAMTRLQFWRDDRQIVRLVCEKRYAEVGRWEVCVREIQEGKTL